LAQAKRQPTLDEVKAKIALYGFTAKELGFADVSKPVPTTEKKPVAIKYRDGDNTWTGRGRQPKWLEKKITEGSKLEDFAVEKV